MIDKTDLALLKTKEVSSDNNDIDSKEMALSSKQLALSYHIKRTNTSKSAQEEDVKPLSNSNDNLVTCTDSSIPVHRSINEDKKNEQEELANSNNKSFEQEEDISNNTNIHIHKKKEENYNNKKNNMNDNINSQEKESINSSLENINLNYNYKEKYELCKSDNKIRENLHLLDNQSNSKKTGIVSSISNTNIKSEIKEEKYQNIKAKITPLNLSTIKAGKRKKKSDIASLMDTLEKSKRDTRKSNHFLLSDFRRYDKKEEKNNKVRRDKYNTPITKFNRKKVKISFKDTLGEGDLVEYIQIASYKKFNYMNDCCPINNIKASEATCQCCSIF